MTTSICYLSIYLHQHRPSGPSDHLFGSPVRPARTLSGTAGYRPGNNNIFCYYSIYYNDIAVHNLVLPGPDRGGQRPWKKKFRTTFEYSKITRSRYMSNIRILHLQARIWRKSRQSIVVDSPRPRGRNEDHHRSEHYCERWPDMENISFNVDQLVRLSRTEQAQRLEEAERRIDDVQRAAANDPVTLNWVDQQRQYLVEMQHQIFAC